MSARGGRHGQYQDATTVDTVVSLADRLRAYAALGEEARSDG